MSGSAQHAWRKNSAGACAHCPASVQPAVAYGSGDQDTVAEWSGDDALREHTPDKQGPGTPHQQQSRTQPDVCNALMEFMKVAGHRVTFLVMGFRHADGMAAPPH